MERIFISSAGDLRELRGSIDRKLSHWLRENGYIETIVPYLWEDDKEDGRLFSDRIGAQPQLPDPASADIPFVICMFGERCGTPLRDIGERAEQFKQWLATDSKPGLRHPWPSDDNEASQRALNRGEFPLTGTVYELLSAHLKEQKAANLIIGYVTSEPVGDNTSTQNIVFNSRRLLNRLTATASKAEQDVIDREIYDPQVQAIVNLIRFHDRTFCTVKHYTSMQEMEYWILYEAKIRLSEYLRRPRRNPFKPDLIHWSIEDREELPGRHGLIEKIVAKLHERHDRLVLLSGKSGCGKSSLMQRGVLGRLSRKKGALVIAFRPTDLGDNTERPDRMDRLWQMIANVVCLPQTATGANVFAMRSRSYAKRLCEFLEKNSAHLYIGIDQFEEMIDELKVCAGRGEGSSDWEPVLEFLSGLSVSPRIRLIGTLESSRENSFESLALEKKLGLTRNVIHVDIGPDDVAEIAGAGFSNGGLRLDDGVLEAIKTRWRAFDERAGLKHASSLPLACLFFNRLYSTFENIAAPVADRRPRGDFARAESGDTDPRLTLDIIGGLKAIAFEDIIEHLATDAWHAGGGQTTFAEPIETDPNFDELDNLLGPCIGIDSDGCIQLRTFGLDDADPSTVKHRKAFAARRLLVPADVPLTDKGHGHRRYKLVHQAVIDRWSLAKRWKDYASARLQIEYRFRSEAMHKSSIGDEEIEQAAIALSCNWLPQHYVSHDPQDAKVRDCAIRIFSAARNPLAISNPRTGSTYAHLAASYHLVDLLAQFARNDETTLHALSKDGDSLLHSAAWSSGPAVEWLLEHGVSMRPPGSEWNAIAASITMGLDDNYDGMAARIESPDEPIGPNGLRIVHCAAGAGNLHVLRKLHGCRAAMDILTAHKHTALHSAALSDQVAAFKYLLPMISPLAENAWGDTPIGDAAARGSLQVLQAFLAMNSNRETLEATLTHRNSNGDTPLMIAARHRRPEIVRCLLQPDLAELIDLTADDHRDKDGRTLFHLVFDLSGTSRLFDEDLPRAREIVRLLLDDRRLDPTLRDGEGRTAFDFDVEKKFEDVQEMIRQDDRVPQDYDSLSHETRRKVLSSRRTATVMRLISEAPRALTARHGHETGLQILTRGKNVAVLTNVVEEELISWQKLQAEVDGMINVAGTATGKPLRAALGKRVTAEENRSPLATRLLDACIRAGDWNTAGALGEKGVPFQPTREELGMTVLHACALANDGERFKRIASFQRIALPLDRWGRRPSDLAPGKARESFVQLENRLFEKPAAPERALSTKFHYFAHRGDVAAFEHQARGVAMAVPLDHDGKRPSDIAPKNMRDAIRAIEDRYFREVQ